MQLCPATQRYLVFTQDARSVVSAGPLRGPRCGLIRNVLEQRIKEAQ